MLPLSVDASVDFCQWDGEEDCGGGDLCGLGGSFFFQGNELSLAGRGEGVVNV